MTLKALQGILEQDLRLEPPGHVQRPPAFAKAKFKREKPTFKQQLNKGHDCARLVGVERLRGVFVVFVYDVLRILIYLVMYGYWYVSLEHLLLSRHPSQSLSIVSTRHVKRNNNIQA